MYTCYFAKLKKYKDAGLTPLRIVNLNNLEKKMQN